MSWLTKKRDQHTTHHTKAWSPCMTWIRLNPIRGLTLSWAFGHWIDWCRQDNGLLYNPPTESSFVVQSISPWLHHFCIPFYI